MPQKERPPMRPFIASIVVGGRPFVFPVGHPRAGEVVEFPIRPGAYEVVVSAGPHYRARFAVEVNEDGRSRIGLLERTGRPDPAAFGLSALEGELLDGLAGIIAQDMLRRRQVA